MENRCFNICGIERTHCFIRNGKQIKCIADMILNKVSGILGIIELTLEENHNDKTARNLQEATESMHELTNWVKFLQIAHDLRELRIQAEETGVHEKRKDVRYPFPDVYHEYLKMKIKVSGSFIIAIIKNFSSRGVQFSSHKQFDINSVIECVFYTTHTIEKQVDFKARIRYCYKANEEFFIGVEIEEISDSINFDFFHNVFDFIKDTIPEIS